MLPIHPFLPQIAETLASHKNLVLQAEPGAGKSTALPLSLLEAPWLGNKKIIMLEPRRLAAKSIAHFLARQLGEKPGGRIGYQVKNDRKVSTATKLEIVTEGILTRRLQNDPELSNIGLIILDEFHERSIHSDLSLMLTLEVQQSIRDDLKILVMSATIDAHKVAQYLDNAPVIFCPGRAYPVSVTYLQKNDYPDRRQLTTQVISALRTVLSSSQTGDILVFLPGQADINQCLNEAEKAFNGNKSLLFLPLYGGLSIEQQELAIMPADNDKRRIVFSTNIAETSLTIEGIACVIDSGLEKVLVYDPQSNMTRLETSYISKASAEQRKGRAGRLQEGTCIRLWSETKHQTLRAFQDEEILSADLASLVLDLLAWGVSDFDTINWLNQPPPAHINVALELLITLDLVNRTAPALSVKISPKGIRATQLGVHPRLASMLLSANTLAEQALACDLAALLAENNIFANTARVDVVEHLLALQDYRANRSAAQRSWHLKAANIEQVIHTSNALKKVIRLNQQSPDLSLSDTQHLTAKLLLHAYPDRLAKQRSAGSGRYQLANGRGAVLKEQDTLYDSTWLVVCDCNAQKKEGHIFSAVAITLDLIHEQLGHLITETEEYSLDAKKQTIIGRRITSYRAITLHEQPITISESAFQSCLQGLLRSEGLNILNWTEACDAWLARASWLASVMEGFPVLSKDALLHSIDHWLLPYLTNIKRLEQLREVDILVLIKSCLTWEQQQLLNQEAPEFYKTPSQKHIPIRYDLDQGPTVSVRLQEMFGELTSPRLGGNAVPLRFELLSPAQRPIQTTSDLAYFWNNSYFEVAKEMRGRYPRHRWPEHPLLEKPGHSIKHKRTT